ncbi:site-specific integrase [uncultured Rikenella sp.]|uniref:site-specific integrase n=1 Tax=uncultured Rikenella sp. TaxID=368003 RepID=UPI0025FF1935|nr:site-specific integrase [uncultured Rikenella sp.]
MTTVELVCYKYKPLKNGELPLKIRITKDRKIRYVNLGVSTKPEHWDFSKNQPKSNCPNREQLERLIANKIGEVKAQIVELKADRKEFTATSLVQKINNRDKSVSVRELFQAHLKYLAEMNRTGYMLSIRQTFNSLSAFSSSLDIPFSDIDVAWLRRYETWLRKQGKSENTIGIRFRNLRMIYNLAIEKGIVKKEYYPFASYKVSKLHKATAKRAIPKEAIRAIIHYPVKDKDFYTRLAVSLFSFSYFMGGINFVDMAYLSSKNIVGGRLIYTRRKTGKLINLPLSSEALSALEAWKHTGSNYLFPILSSVHKTEQMRLNRLHKVITKVNNALKQLGEHLQLPVKLTTYVARHSFATVLKREGVSTSIICESLGHSSEKTTQIYLDSFENTQIDEAMKHLL